MRRFFNRVLTILSALSLLLCLTAAGLWVRSYSVSSCVPQFVQANQLQVHSAVGRLVFLSTREPDPKPGQFFNAHTLIVGDRRVPLDGIDKAEWQQLAKEHWPLRSREMSLGTGAATAGNGFGFDVQIWRPGGPWYLIVPYWAVVALFGAMPLTRLAGTVLRRRRAARSRCARCGRELRAGVDRCPSCGLPIEAEGQGAPDPHA